MKTFTTLACAVLLALTVATTFAQSTIHGKPLPELTDEQLETEYLACEHAVGEGLLGVDLATHCSVIYEAFKSRAFEGDFGRMLAWWHQRQGSTDPLEAP